MKIYALKLITGEEILGEVVKTTDHSMTLKNPVGIAIVRGQNGQPNVGFSPFPLHAEQKSDSTIDLSKTHIVYSYVPAQDFIDNYNQIFGSGIVLPNKKIITG
jgi:hypothetical protein